MSYTDKDIANELQRTALNMGYYGNALRVAKDFSFLDSEEKALLDKFASRYTICSFEDRMNLQDIAIKIRMQYTER